jgi:DNA replicative helicase MCM subunit Mcm2 (Cdc46/Mcm family)
LQHDLVDKCHPGDEIVVVGLLLPQWQQNAQTGLECNVGMALKAHSVRVIQENGSSAWQQTDAESSVGEMEKYRKEFDTYWSRTDRVKHPVSARDFICTAVCPKLYGLSIVKLALLLTLIGGVPSSSCQKSDNGDTDDQHEHNVGGDDDGDLTSPQSMTRGKPLPFKVIQNEQSPDGSVYSKRGSGTPSQKKGLNNLTVQTRRRDMSHMLIIGDPGKYEFLI